MSKKKLEIEIRAILGELFWLRGKYIVEKLFGQSEGLPDKAEWLASLSCIQHWSDPEADRWSLEQEQIDKAVAQILHFMEVNNCITLQWEPEEVDVSDDRETVRGASVILTTSTGSKWEFNVIPPEGMSPDCWLGHDGGTVVDTLVDVFGADQFEVLSLMEMVAKKGALGASGKTTMLLAG
jgi:hypothetical protein